MLEAQSEPPRASVERRGPLRKPGDVGPAPPPHPATASGQRMTDRGPASSYPPPWLRGRCLAQPPSGPPVAQSVPPSTRPRRGLCASSWRGSPPGPLRGPRVVPVSTDQLKASRRPPAWAPQPASRSTVPSHPCQLGSGCPGRMGGPPRVLPGMRKLLNFLSSLGTRDMPRFPSGSCTRGKKLREALTGAGWWGCVSWPLFRRSWASPGRWARDQGTQPVVGERQLSHTWPRCGHSWHLPTLGPAMSRPSKACLGPS